MDERPPKIEPRKAMANAIKASVVVEHASQCSLDPRPKIICRESLFHLRRIKEALYLKSNSTINRDNGVAVSEVWGALINKLQCCTLPSQSRPLFPCAYRNALPNKQLLPYTADDGTRAVPKRTVSRCSVLMSDNLLIHSLVGQFEVYLQTHRKTGQSRESNINYD
ncbi:hypothetical protein M513_13307 [Trichuris suis]|uniref:Uncharacterized protein n=1 Tax=Trichuris suis TaxID=68888 RepID=A0A085LLG7_9BILA|nr:hypothetical protein M513_13307 [Trichuris suis]